MDKTPILIFLILFFFGCSSKEGKKDQVVTNEGSETELQIITVSNQQFEKGKMVMGKMVKRKFTNPVHANGYIDVPPENRAHVSALFGGYVQNIKLLVGDRVEKGQFLVNIMNPDFIKIQQDYLDIKEQLEYLKSEYDRQKILSEENISSQKNFLKAKSEYHSALAKIAALKENLMLLHIDLSNVEAGKFTSVAKVFAPISGSITKLLINNGTYVQPTDELMEIINLNHKHLELQVFENEVLKVREGQLIEYRVPDFSSETFNGEVHLVGKAIDEEKRLVKVHGHLENEDMPFITGMYIEALILTDTVETWSLPISAVFEKGEVSFVLVRDGQDSSVTKFTKKEIMTGRKDADYVEIINPEIFNEEDQILLKGGFQLVKID